MTILEFILKIKYILKKSHKTYIISKTEWDIKTKITDNTIFMSNNKQGEIYSWKLSY